MDLGALFLVLAVILIVAIVITRPFFQAHQPGEVMLEVDANEHRHSALLAEQDRILSALQELDFDHALGKIPEEEYPEQRAALVQQGAAVLRALDEFAGEAPRQPAEARLEAAAASRAAAARPPAAEDDLETLIAARRQTRSEKTAGFCPRCGRPLQNSDRFCPKCGSAVH